MPFIDFTALFTSSDAGKKALKYQLKYAIPHFQIQQQFLNTCCISHVTTPQYL